MDFNAHAEVAVPARARARLERLCRYVCRPPIAQQRLEEHPSGELRYAFKKRWKGRHRRAPTRAARSDRARVRPRASTSAAHGALPRRAQLARQGSKRGRAPSRHRDHAWPCGAARAFGDNESTDSEPRRRSLGLAAPACVGEDLQSCPHCTGAMRWLEAATTPDAIARLLAKHGLGSAPATEATAARPALARVPQDLSCWARHAALSGRVPSSMRLHGPGSVTKSAWRRLHPASAGALRPLPRVQAGRSAVRITHPRRFSSFESLSAGSTAMPGQNARARPESRSALPRASAAAAAARWSSR